MKTMVITLTLLMGLIFLSRKTGAETDPIVVIGTEETYGTGFVVESTKSYSLIVTANHVLREHTTCIVAFNDMSEHDGLVMKTDKKKDIALILVFSGKRKPVKFQKHEAPNWTKVKSIGHPQALLYTRSNGYVQNNTRTTESGIKMYQIEMEIQGGASGSPVWTRKGVIGMILSYQSKMPSACFILSSEEIITFLTDG